MKYKATLYMLSSILYTLLMHSLIVLSSSSTARETYLQEIIQKEQISTFDTIQIRQIEESTKKKAAKKASLEQEL